MGLGIDVKRPRIGFVGLGNMGGPMCSRLLAAGYVVKAYDLNESALEKAVGDGASRASSAVECATDVDILLTSLPRPDHVRAVMSTAQCV